MHAQMYLAVFGDTKSKEGVTPRFWTLNSLNRLSLLKKLLKVASTLANFHIQTQTDQNDTK